MTSPRRIDVAGLRIALMDSVAGSPQHGVDVPDADVVVVAEPASLAVARRLLRISPRLIVLHDAGVGKDGAGIAGLDRLGDVGLPAAAVRHHSARIGDASDVFTHGVVGHLNAAAESLGLREGPLKPQLEAFGRGDTGQPVSEEQVA